MQRKVTIQLPQVPMYPDKKRVAAYARVSGGKDSMLHSLSAQVSYYSDLIRNNPQWEYVGVYADEACTGTKDVRDEFQRLLMDCRTGKIDMIITKSISRFARNTVTMLEIVRELKLLNIDVFFENENIHSISGDGELMLTILASFAQEESRSASDNCKWRIRKRLQEGEITNLRYLYGYRISKETIEINPEQADVVRMIFDDYVNGMSCHRIAMKLRRLGVKTMRNGTWSTKHIAEILKNEKYKGDALLQKYYVQNHLSKKLVRNNGDLPMYYAEGTHAAIIDATVFEKANKIMSKHRGQNRPKTSAGRYPFSSMIVCARCGKKYKRVTKYARHAWNCSTYLVSGSKACYGKQIPEDILYALTTKTLGLVEFDETVFKSRIKKMRVPGPNRVTFVFANGHEVETTWCDRSRKDSWTDKARQRARERTLQQRRNRQ